MIQKNLLKFAQDNWENHKKSIAECSKPSENGMPLVESDKIIYCFDDICKEQFCESKLPASTDGVDFIRNEIRFVEFKSGFRDRITRENYKDSKKSICEHSGEACEDFWGQFFKLREKEKEELIANLKLKALDTYVMLEKKIIPLCEDLETNKMRIRLIIVIDADPVECMEDILGEVSSKNLSQSNWISRIRNSLARFLVEKDVLGNDYLYDRIDVFSVQDYLNLIRA